MSTEKTSERAADAPATEAKQEAEPELSGAPRFPIVGIGASAGGLAAFEAFFSGMPSDANSGMAFVLVQHLAPDHKSILSELVKRYTRMDVFDVKDGMRVQPNCAYIIPPNRDMAFLNGALQLLEPALPRGQRLPIDFFFRSLAQDQHERAICIVLSGTGSDGTQGLRAIKAEGGIALAQAPETTEFDAMPRSAIDTGLVDFVLPPSEMPAQLIAYATRAFWSTTRGALPLPQKVDDLLKKILILLRAQTGHDFSQYKQNTISRRVERRMAVQQIDQLDAYLRFLQETPSEIGALFRDLLIGVTGFFRDPEAFEALQGHLDALLANKPSGSLVRVWVPGCSTGEEAYSLAILLREAIDARKQGVKLQVFATDIDNRAIDTARAGLYPAAIANDISPERLSRCFSSDGGVYQIHKSIRDVLVFSEHDVIKDPPFSKLDLISCRNLMIYMGSELQRRLIPLFHYALNPHGMLLLGTSETVGDFGHLFAALDRKTKLYQRKEDPYGVPRPALGKFLPRPLDGAGASSVHKSSREAELPLRELIERSLLEVAPASALINEQGELLYLHGHTGKYLEPAPGEAALNILKMAREGLRMDLTTALYRAVAQKEAVRCPGLRVKSDGGFLTVDLLVQPLGNEVGANKIALFLVTFHEVQPPPTDLSAPLADSESEASVDQRIAALKHELRAKDEYLQSTHEQMQTANEELQSSNEELQSTNEELQSTNEELETSKEELQSVNEELATVNSELQTKVADLSRANNDMNNLLAGTGIGTIFVDHQLRIQRFTPVVTQLINLIRTDVGRPLGHIVSNLIGYDQLVEDVRNVLETLAPKEVEVKTQSGAWYLLRIRPYRTLENVIEGAVITFTEISDRKKAQAVLRDAEELRRMAAVMRDAQDAITVQAMDGRILAWNRGAERMYGWNEAEALAMNIRAVTPENRQQESLEIVTRLSRAEILAPFAAQRIAKSGKIIDVSLTATALVNERGEVYAVATVERVTGH